MTTQTDSRLPKDERLRSFGAIRRLFRDGRGGFIYPFRFVVYAEPDPEMSACVLFSTPKKFHKRANKRNLLRRRMREAYRLNEAGFKSGFDIVIVARHGCGEAPFSALEGEMRALFAGLNMSGGGTNG